MQAAVTIFTLVASLSTFQVRDTSDIVAFLNVHYVISEKQTE